MYVYGRKVILHYFTNETTPQKPFYNFIMLDSRHSDSYCHKMQNLSYRNRLVVAVYLYTSRKLS